MASVHPLTKKEESNALEEYISCLVMHCFGYSNYERDETLCTVGAEVEH